MATTKSDNKLRQLRLSELLTQEVFGSQFTDALYGTSFDRHLSKDDSVRIAGYIGTGNPNALVNRQIKEFDTFRQAYQLQPVAYSKKGDVDDVLSYENFLSLLELLNVERDRLPVWANTESFNFAPPVNPDMLINYQDYYWVDEDNGRPQYFTIENKCNKLTTKLNSYDKMLQSFGSTFFVSAISIANNTMTIDGALTQVFVPGFMFYTLSATPALNDKFWTVVDATYEPNVGTTTVILEPMASKSETAPINPVLDQMWYIPSTKLLYTWNGDEWVLTSQNNMTATISLLEMREAYRNQRNCACEGDYGWDIKQWDDNQQGQILWNTELLAQISFDTEAEWNIANPGPKTNNSLWYDTAHDQLKMWSLDTASWKLINNRFSNVLKETTGNNVFDAALGCEVQVLNDWSTDNKWKHKTEITSFSGAIRAQVPILEYSADAELNEWVTVDYAWKYRSSPARTFEYTNDEPIRIELEPIKGFVAAVQNGVWTFYLYDKTKFMDRDVDYTGTFVPGYRFAIRNDIGDQHLQTVATAEYRNLTLDDASEALTRIGQDVMVTIITIQETSYGGPTIAGPLNDRIEPLTTSQGDPWNGYHVHWMLDTTATSLRPAGNPTPNTYITNPTKTVTKQLAGVGVMTVTDTAQELSVFASNITTIAIDDSLRYSSSSANFYATPDAITVYVNGSRLDDDQFTNTLVDTVVNYVIVGDVAYSGVTISTVAGIVLADGVNDGDVVRIEVGAQSQKDIASVGLPVRTVEDENDFAILVNTNQQPVYKSLLTTVFSAQNKTVDNQYPLFNIYDIIANEVVRAAPPFAFAESEEMSVNEDTRKRILVTPDKKEFGFEQNLVDESTGVIYAYRNTKAISEGTFWYNPLTRQVQLWINNSWTSSILLTAPSRRMTVPAVGTIRPTNPLQGDYWYNPSTDIFQQYNGIRWMTITSPVVNETDPTLFTVWRTGTPATEYVPAFVDANRNQVPTTDPEGTWELLDSWYFNASHENRKNVKYSQLLTHFRSMIAAQAAVSGLAGAGAYTLTQDQYNFGLGGTIKEFNDGLDTLISAMNVENSTPVSLIDFAQLQYANLLTQLREQYVRHAASLFGVYTPESMNELPLMVAEGIITEMQENSFLASIYYDSTAYDNNTKIGMPNWIATLPLLRVVDAVRPYTFSNDNGSIGIVHHDGHRSTLSFTATEIDGIARSIISQKDPRRADATLGLANAAIPPQTASQFTQRFGGTEVRTGVYWYRTSTTQLFRFIPYVISSAPPANVPAGTMYYDQSSLTVFRFNGSAWNAITTPGSGDISPLWQEISITQYMADVVLDVETRLYDITVATNADLPLRVDFDATLSAEDEQLKERELEKRFMKFALQAGIRSPLVNSNYSATDPFTWNYSQSTIAVYPTAVTLDVVPTDWKFLYKAVYGTAFPNIEPWILQGYQQKPEWWDEEYANDDPVTYGNRRWKYVHNYTNSTGVGMWENIRTGLVPIGRTLPNGNISEIGNERAPKTYSYFSVNIGNTTTADGKFQPDDVLPPYFDTSLGGDAVRIRSVFDDYSSQIFGPSADYRYGDQTTYEWAWQTSINYAYDQLVVQFVLQPMRTMHTLFGPEFTLVGELQVAVDQKQVLSHKNTLFHGDVYNENVVYKVNGFDQWYMNFNRYAGYDSNDAFRSLWCGWNPTLSYLTASTIDTAQLQLRHKYFDITDRDYGTTFAMTGILDDIWIDAFRASILQAPPAIMSYNNDGAWRIELSTNAPSERPLPYYRAITYPFQIGANDTCTVNVFDIVGASNANRQFVVNGNQETLFKAGWIITVSGSLQNDGDYTVVSVVYDATTDRSRINVQETLVNSIGVGTLTIKSISSLINTGDLVHITSSGGVPAPLVEDGRYYAIRLNDTQFKLAISAGDAANGIAITGLSSPKKGHLQIGKVKNTFRIYGGAVAGNKVWYHYELDHTDVREFIPPHPFSGLQTILNVIDGYVEYMNVNDGVIYESGDILTFDQALGRSNGWQLEQEKFLTWALAVRSSRLNVVNRYPVSVSTVNDTHMKIGQGNPKLKSGTRIAFTSSGVLPAPLMSGVSYYYVPVDETTFQVSTSSVVSAASIVHFTTGGTATTFMQEYDRNIQVEAHELNPFKTALQITTPRGVIADVFSGPYAETSTQQLIYDQDNHRINSDQLLAYRQDESTILSYTADPSLIHLGGGHLYVEGYEHLILFNNYSVEGALMYDPFVGLNVQRVEIDFYREPGAKLRPTIGGYYMLNGEFFRNMEGQADDLRYVYDLYKQRSSSLLSQYASSLFGFKASTALEQLGVGDKSQQLFYRGMIQQKGSTNAVKAFVNSKYFLDATIDEFWARRTATFGDSRPRLWPEVKLLNSDTTVDDVRFLFLDQNLEETPASLNVPDQDNFTPISFGNYTDRWQDYPSTRQYMNNVPLAINCTPSDKMSIFASTTSPEEDILHEIDVWTNTSTWTSYKVRNGVLTSEIVNTIVYNPGNNYVVVIAPPNDGVYMVRKVQVGLRQSDTISDETNSIAVPNSEGYGIIYDMWYDSGYNNLNSNIIKFPGDDFVGIYELYFLNAAYDENSPTKVVDNKQNQVLRTMQLWDPARNHPYYKAEHNVDIKFNTDPAAYSNPKNVNNQSAAAWNVQEVGKIWIDTNRIEYLPYYDKVLMPNVNDRLYNWGQLAPWASVNVYEWVESTSLPDVWDEEANRDETMGLVKRDVFKRVRDVSTISVQANSNIITVNNTEWFDQDLEIGDGVYFFSDTGDYPSYEENGVSDTVAQGTMYYIVSLMPFAVSSVLPVGNAPSSMIFTQTIADNFTIVPQFKATWWVKDDLVRQRIYAAVNTAMWTAEPTVPVTAFDDGDLVDAYVNGTLVGSALEVRNEAGILVVTLPSTTLKEEDIVDIVREPHLVTTEEQDFDPDVNDDGETLIQWNEDAQYSIATPMGTSEARYYFWVQGRKVKSQTNPIALSSFEVQRDWINMPDPYFVAQMPLPSSDKTQIAQYREVVLRGLHGLITENNRFVWRMIRDETLRDQIRGDLKPKHEQWEMFRKDQSTKIDRDLWDKVTESMIGRSLANPTIRVPSLDRELYDRANGTATSIGLGDGQAFTTKSLAFASLFGYLGNPDNDFYPVDVDQFVNSNDFTTAAGITAAMDELYQTFNNQDVNNIWFEMLQDSLSLQPKYEGLMKTSWVALSGIRVLDVGGMFDD